MEQEVAPRDVLMRAFPGIAAKEATEIISCGKLLAFPAEAVICKEGEYGRTFYIILEGEARVTKKVSNLEQRGLTTLGRGGFFGEMAIIGDAPRAATVTANAPLSALEIPKEAFTGVLQSNNMVLLAIIRSVTNRLRENDEMTTEDLRVKAKELADSYQQLAEEEYARSQFLSVIAHELRTPLTAAGGFLEVIRMGMLQGEALEEALDTVARNLQEIIALTNDILFMQEMEMIMPQFQPVNIASVVTLAVEQQRGYAERNQVGIMLDIASDVPMVNGHARSLQRAMNVILENSIKFSPDGGGVEIYITREDAQVKVVVRDHGVGIPPEILPRIFQRFFHMDQVGKHMFRGIGIGLSIARQVIKQHHGKINVDSEVGKGSTFTITLDAVSA